MEDYKTIFDVLDAIESCKESIQQANTFRQELAFMGEPRDKQLKEIYRNTLRMIDYNIKSNQLILDKLELLYLDWRNNE
jgi:hypothetical protein